MARVTFFPLNKVREIKAGATILAAANQTGVPIGQSCSGDGICGWCRVTVIEGQDQLFPPSERESHLIAERGLGPDERAACMARIKGDITITTTYWAP
jgi:ferredoxin